MKFIQQLPVLVATAAMLGSSIPLFAQEKDEPESDALSRTVQSSGLIIAWPESNDELRGFSQTTGEWKTIPIDPVDEMVPIIHADVACVVAGKSVAAFSAVAGRWDVLRLSNALQRRDDDTWPVTMEPRLVQLQADDHLYTFSASKGRWTSPTDPELQSSATTFKLQHVSAHDLAREIETWISSQNPADVHGSLMMTNQNVTIRADRRSWSELAIKKLRELDVPSTSVVVDPLTTDSPEAGYWAAPDGLSIRQMKTRLQDKEQQSVTTAESLRTKATPVDADREKLTDLVDEAFRIRQAMQLADLDRMQARLQKIKANLNARQQNRDRIVRRRVEELLDPNGAATQWNTLPAGLSPGVHFDRPSNTTPIGLAGPPHIPLGAPGLATLDPGRKPEDMIKWKQPGEIATQLRFLRTLTTNAQRLRPAEMARLVRVSRPLREWTAAEREGVTEVNRLALIAAGKQAVAREEQKLETSLSDWKRAWSTYQTQLRLLKLKGEEVSARIEPLENNYANVSRMKDKGLIAGKEVQDMESKLKVANIQLQGAMEVLKLYSEIETDEPQLNPATFESPRSAN
jgi:hypothetical protein